ncbi:MAG: MMPL family transporter [Gammaproteobacteria bacterium]|nr:MMPL family transporter [Gammaproteobacteria bacterium]
MMDHYAKWILMRPWFVFSVSLLLVFIVSMGIFGLEFRSDARVFFSDENPELLELERFEEKYGRENTLVFIVSAREGDLFTPSKLTALTTLTDMAWAMPYTKRVNSVTNFQRVVAQGDDIVIDHLYRKGDEISLQDAQALKQAAMQEPMLSGQLLSHDAKVGLVAVEFRLDDTVLGDPAFDLTEQAREIITDFEATYDEFDLRLSGSLALDNAFGEAGANDGALLTPIMVTLMLFLIWLIFRSLWVVTAITVIIFAAIACGMGVAGMLGIPLSSPSITAPFIILTLATADCIHLVSAISRFRRENPDEDKSWAIQQGLKETVRPITMTSLATAVGFFSLMFSESPPFAHLGIISGFGTLFAWGFSLTLLPVFLLIFPWRVTQRRPLIPESLWIFVHGLVTRHTNKVIVISLVSGLGLSALAVTNKLDDRYVQYFDKRFEFRNDTDYMNQHIGGFYTIDYSPATDRDGITEPEYLNQLDQFSEWLRKQPEVSHVHSLADIMKTLNRAMNGGNEENYVLPTDKYVASQYLWLYEMSLPMGLDLKEQITLDKSESRLTVSLYDVSTSEMLDLVRRAGQWMDEHTPLLSETARATGTSVIFSYIGQRNIDQMLKGTLLALLAISVLLFFLFKSFVLGVFATLANFIPPVAALGGWALIIGEVGMAVAAIVAVTLGIVVDDTIHLIEALRRERKCKGVDHSQAILNAMKHSGPGILITTIVLVAGFSCLAISGFQINAWMGLMTAIVISLALIFDFLFLPSVIYKTRKL